MLKLFLRLGRSKKTFCLHTEMSVAVSLRLSSASSTLSNGLKMVLQVVPEIYCGFFATNNHLPWKNHHSSMLRKNLKHYSPRFHFTEINPSKSLWTSAIPGFTSLCLCLRMPEAMEITVGRVSVLHLLFPLLPKQWRQGESKLIYQIFHHEWD